MKKKKPYFHVAYIDGTEMRFDELSEVNKVVGKNEQGKYIHKNSGVPVAMLYFEDFDTLGRAKRKLLYPITGTLNEQEK